MSRRRLVLLLVLAACEAGGPAAGPGDPPVEAGAVLAAAGADAVVATTAAPRVHVPPPGPPRPAFDPPDVPGPAPWAPCALPEPGPYPFAEGALGEGVDFVHHFGRGYCGMPDNMGSGVCAFDHDGDGDTDLYFVDHAPHPNRLYRNYGGVFADVTEETGAGDTGDGMGCLAFDADGDRDLDLLVVNDGPAVLLRNEGRTFVDGTADFGLVADGMGSSATAGDMDGDGDLDLFVARFVDPLTCDPKCTPDPDTCTPLRSLLFENRGGTFVEVGVERGIVHEDPTLASLFYDADEDGDLDLWVGNDLGDRVPDRLYENDGTGRFEERAAAFGLAADADGNSGCTMGVDVGDFDGDGGLDLVSTSYSGHPTLLFRCGGGARCLEVSRDVGLEASQRWVRWGGGFVDLDLDGDLDLFTSTGRFQPPMGQPDELFWNDGGRFRLHVPVDAEPLAAVQPGRGVAFGDLDLDGDPDVVVADMGAPPQILENTAATGGWLKVELDPWSAGARVTVTAGPRRLTEQLLLGGSYLGSSEPVLTFGLGDSCTADVEVRWLDGTTRTFAAVPSNTHLLVDR